MAKLEWFTMHLVPLSTPNTRMSAWPQSFGLYLLVHIWRNYFLIGQMFIRWFRIAMGRNFHIKVSKYFIIVHGHSRCPACKTWFRWADGRKFSQYLIYNISLNRKIGWVLYPTNHMRVFNHLGVPLSFWEYLRPENFQILQTQRV